MRRPHPAAPVGCTAARGGARPAATSLVAGLVAAMTVACAAEEPQTAAGTPERRVVVVPATAAPARWSSAGPPCTGACPPPRAGEDLAGCHAADPHRPRASTPPPGEPEWVVCYFGPAGTAR